MEIILNFGRGCFWVRDFCQHESFVGVRFMLTQEFLLSIISFISNSRKGKIMAFWLSALCKLRFRLHILLRILQYLCSARPHAKFLSNARRIHSGQKDKEKEEYGLLWAVICCMSPLPPPPPSLLPTLRVCRTACSHVIRIRGLSESPPPPHTPQRIMDRFWQPRPKSRRASILETVSMVAEFGQQQWLCMNFWCSDRTLRLRDRIFEFSQEMVKICAAA